MKDYIHQQEPAKMFWRWLEVGWVQMFELLGLKEIVEPLKINFQLLKKLFIESIVKLQDSLSYQKILLLVSF